MIYSQNLSYKNPIVPLLNVAGSNPIHAVYRKRSVLIVYPIICIWYNFGLSEFGYTVGYVPGRGY